jgi:hypothetical protein
MIPTLARSLWIRSGRTPQAIATASAKQSCAKPARTARAAANENASLYRPRHSLSLCAIHMQVPPPNDYHDIEPWSFLTRDPQRAKKRPIGGREKIRCEEEKPDQPPQVCHHAASPLPRKGEAKEEANSRGYGPVGSPSAAAIADRGLQVASRKPPPPSARSAEDS